MMNNSPVGLKAKEVGPFNPELLFITVEIVPNLSTILIILIVKSKNYLFPLSATNKFPHLSNAKPKGVIKFSYSCGSITRSANTLFSSKTWIDVTITYFYNTNICANIYS